MVQRRLESVYRQGIIVHVLVLGRYVGGPWIKKKEMNDAGRIRSKRLREVRKRGWKYGKQ